ncbi:MAG: hypothetical protein ACI33J_06815 [Clostridium sp.]
MKILNFKENKVENSIYELMKKCTVDNKLDEDKFDDLINPREDGKIKINSAFMDQFFGISEEEKIAQVPRILDVLLKIYNDDISLENVEKELKSIEFKTLNIIDELRSKLTNDNYNIKTYNTFKKLMYITTDKEIFKFSLEMTAIIERCEELIDDYILIGQSEEFSKYISFILLIWSEKPKFLNALFDLLDKSSDWGAINYGEMLMNDEEIMSNIKNQRRILIGTLKNNCIKMEIAYDLASDLNIKKLSKMSYSDKELSMAFVDLYSTLFFERQPCGGIFNLRNPFAYIKWYLNCIKFSKFKDVKFVGINNILEFLNDDNNKEEFIDLYDEETYNLIKNEVDFLWNNINTVDNIKEIINEGEDYIYFIVDFVKKNNIVEVVPMLEKLYIEKPTYENSYLEGFLSQMGSDSIKMNIYENLKKEYKERMKMDKKYSYLNLFGEEYKIRHKIENKIYVLAWQGAKDYELIEKMLEDYDPMVRSKALKVINKSNYYVDNSVIRDKIKKKLSDSPIYIRKNALEICEKINLEITKEEIDKIIEEIKEREGDINHPMDKEVFEKLIRLSKRQNA